MMITKLDMASIVLMGVFFSMVVLSLLAGPLSRIGENTAAAGPHHDAEPATGGADAGVVVGTLSVLDAAQGTFKLCNVAANGGGTAGTALHRLDGRAVRIRLDPRTLTATAAASEDERLAALSH